MDLHLTFLRFLSSGVINELLAHLELICEVKARYVTP